MRVFATVVEQSVWRAFVDLSTAEKTENLQTAIAAQLLLTTLTPEQVSAILQQHTQAELWLSYDAPEFFIARQLTAGKTLAEAIILWQAYAQHLIQLQSQHRRQLKLVNLQQCQQNPKALPAEFGISKQPVAATHSQLMAATALKQQSVLNELWQHLFACSQPVADSAEYQFDIQALLKNTSTVNQVQQLQKQLQEQQLQSQQQLEHAQQELQQKEQHLCAQLQLEVTTNQELQQQLQLQQLSLSAADQQIVHLHQKLQLEIAAHREALERSTLALNHSQHQFELQLVEAKQQSTDQLQEAATALAQVNDQLASEQQLNRRQAEHLSQLQQENELLLTQLLNVQEELEKHYLQTKDLSAANTGLQQQLQQATDKLQEAATALAQINDQLASEQQLSRGQAEQLSLLQQENELLLTQLLNVQEELEKHYLQTKDLSAANTGLQQQLQQAQVDNQAQTKHIAKLQAQYSALEQQHMALSTKQEQTLAQLNNAQQKLTASEQENQLILEQLMNVQEELESYYLQLQQQKQQALQELQRLSHSEAAKEAQYQRDVTKLESQIRKLKARAASAEHQHQLLKKELGSIKSGVLWKTAAPVRAMKQLVNKKQQSKERLQQHVALILTSEYFDIDWYMQNYPDVAAGPLNPAEHYLRFGAAEGRMPGPLFDGNWYLQRYPDVAETGVNPLLHFVKFGQQEGRSTSPKLLQNPTVNDSAEQDTKI